MGQFAKALRDDAKGATVDWVVMSAGILPLGAVALHAVFVGGMNELASEMNQSFANAPTASGPGASTTIGDGGLGDACAKRLDERLTGEIVADCRSQVRGAE